MRRGENLAGKTRQAGIDMAVFRTDEAPRDADLEVVSLEQARTSSGSFLAFFTTTVAVFVVTYIISHFDTVSWLDTVIHFIAAVTLPLILVLAAILKPVRTSIIRFSRRKLLAAFGAVIIILAVATDVYADYIAPHDPESVGIAKCQSGDRTSSKFCAPGTDGALLGTDNIGRDVLSRLIHGATISMYVGLMTVLIGITIGTAIGIGSAYSGGILDIVVQRLVDALMGFPPIILALGLMAALGASVNNVVIALVVILVPGATRVIRSEALRIKELDYILASRSIGANPFRIMLQHILPNVIAIYIVLMTITLGFAIVVEASLSFLGVGVPEGVPTWGSMLEIGRAHIDEQAWLVVFPGIVIAAAVFAVNFLGDGLRDVLDPRLRGR